MIELFTKGAKIDFLLKSVNKDYIKNGVEMRAKYLPDSDILVCVAGNDWSNLFRDLYFTMIREQLITEGWEPCLKQ